MIASLDAIREQLTTRNEIRYAQDVRYAVNSIRTNHNERVVMLTANGKVVSEKVFTGGERLPELMEVYRLRREWKCEGFENE